MFEFCFRPWFQRNFVDLVAMRLAQAYSPHLITFLALASGLLCPISLLYDMPYLAIAFLLLSGYLDCLDGTLARLQEDTTTIGTVYDNIADFVVEFGVIAALFSLDPASKGLPCFLMLGAISVYTMSLFATELFSSNSANMSMDPPNPGVIGRFELFLAFIIMILFPDWFLWTATAFIILVIWASVMRIVSFTLEPDEILEFEPD